MFRKWIYLFLALMLFALVWAAGHDILKGEPDVWMEWIIVFAGGGLALRLVAQRLSSWHTG
jgi:hypothetical protein